MRARAKWLVLGWALVASVAAAAVRWNEVNRQPDDWYAGAEARAIATSVLAYQTEQGAWPKNTDMTQPPSAAFLSDRRFDHRASTIDNGGTTTQLQFLARFIQATNDAEARRAFDRGIEYLLRAQYESGGWPQYFPLIKGYYTHITYNDNAMINVMLLLDAVAQGRKPMGFVAAEVRARAATAVSKGIACILRTQVKQEGKLTAWCAQHDETTFEPAWARNFEPPTLSGSESVGILRFLMSIERPSPEVVTAVHAGVAWLRSVAITGLRMESTRTPEGKMDRRAVADANAPLIWARFYELGTNRPVYTGRDKIIRYSVNEIEAERRNGYAYLGDWPATLLAKDYPRWSARHPQP